MNDQDTNKNNALPTENELEALRRLCLCAYEEMCKQPTIVNRNTFFEIRKRYEHVKTLYAAGRAALIQKRVIERQ